MKKEFTESFSSYKSLIPGFFLAAGAIYAIVKGIGFEDNTKKVISIVLCSLVGLICIIYLVYVLMSYNFIPRCKRNHTGIIFIIQTNNDTYRNTISDELIYNFHQLSQSNIEQKYDIKVLNKKKTDNLGNLISAKQIDEILNASGCGFCVLIHPSNKELNNNDSIYVLDIVAGAHITKMNEEFSKIITHQFNLAVKNISKKEINPKNNREDLHSLSSQLYYMCQFLFAITLCFSNNTEKANEVLLDVYNKVCKITLNLPLYNDIKHFGGCLLIESSQILNTNIYKDYCYGKNFDFEKYKNQLEIQKSCLDRDSIKQRDPMYTITYYMGHAIYEFLYNRNVSEALNNLKQLDSMFPKHKEYSAWQYSKAFIQSYLEKDLWQIEKSYNRLSKNYTVSIAHIIGFIDRFLKDEDNIGLQTAQFYIYYTRKDIGDAQTVRNLKNTLIKKLKSLKLDNFAKHISSLKIRERDYILKNNK